MDYRQVKIADDARLAPNCTVVGDVEIGSECTVFSGAAIRGDYGAKIVVGERTNIQENAVLHVDYDGKGVTVGHDVTIGHGAIVHGCEIGDGTLVGMGAVVMTGAKVGSGCLVGAGALVTQGTVIPDGFLAFGSPARVVRALAEEEKEALRKDARDYVEAGREMAEQGLMLAGRDVPCDHPTIAVRR